MPHEVTASDGIRVGDRCGLAHEDVRSLTTAGTVTPVGRLGIAHAGTDRQGIHFVHQQHVEGGRSDVERHPDGTLSLTVDRDYPIKRRRMDAEPRKLVMRQGGG